jgi:hypothetical protein
MPGGRHFVMLVNADRRERMPQIEVALNWTGELKRRAVDR